MFDGAQVFKESTFTTISEILAYLLLLIFPLVLFYFYKLFTQIRSTPIRTMWLIQLIVLFAFFILVFPGFISYDDLVLAAAVSDGMPSGWHSFTYSLFTAGGFILFNGFGLTGLISLFVFLLISLKIFHAISESKLSELQKTYLAVLVMFLALHPMNQCQIFYSTRDTLFSLLFFLFGYIYIFEKQRWTFSAIFGFVPLLVLLGDLRPEGKLFLILFPILFLLLKRWNYRHLLTYGLTCAVFLSGFYMMTSDFFGIKTFSHSYEVTAYVLPLSQIFHDKKSSDISDEHYKNIDAVLSVDLLKEKFNAIEIDPFHAGAFNQKASEAEWQSFKKSAAELIYENPGIFLKNRVNLFLSMLNLGQVPSIVADHLREESSVEIETALERLKIIKGVDQQDRSVSFYKKMLYSLTSAENPLSMLISTFLPPLLLLIGCLFFVRFSPSIVAFAALFAARIPILFLLAPASYTKYIYFLFLFFTFVPAIAVLQYLESKIESESVS